MVLLRNSCVRVWWKASQTTTKSAGEMGQPSLMPLMRGNWTSPKGGRPVQILTPNRVRRLLGVRRGGVEGGRWVGRSAAGVPGGGSVDTPTYIPQNDSHDALMFLNIHKWDKKFGFKKFAHQLRHPSAKKVGSGVKLSFEFFTHL